MNYDDFKRNERGYETPAHFFAAFSRPLGTSSDWCRGIGNFSPFGFTQISWRPPLLKNRQPALETILISSEIFIRSMCF